MFGEKVPGDVDRDDDDDDEAEDEEMTEPGYLNFPCIIVIIKLPRSTPSWFLQY